MSPQSRLVVVHPDAQILAEAAASRLLTRILDLQSVRSPVHVVLTGGTVGIKTLAAVAKNPVRDAVDWTGVHLWWGDERYLPAGDADRNETQAREALLDHLDVLPAENVHAMPSVDGSPPRVQRRPSSTSRCWAWAPTRTSRRCSLATPVGPSPGRAPSVCGTPRSRRPSVSR